MFLVLSMCHERFQFQTKDQTRRRPMSMLAGSSSKPPRRRRQRKRHQTIELTRIIIKTDYNFLDCDWFKNHLFLLIHLPSCYQTVCFRTAQYISQSNSRMQFKSTSHIQSCSKVCWCGRLRMFKSPLLVYNVDFPILS